MDDNLKEITINDAEMDDDFEPLFKPRYYISRLLSFLGWSSFIVGSVLSIVSAVMKMDSWITFTLVVYTPTCTGFWLGFSEVVRMLQNKAYDE